MNSLTFLAVASAALFVLVSQGGEAAHLPFKDVLRVTKRDLYNDYGVSPTAPESSESELKSILRKMSQYFEEKISCVPTLKRKDYAVVEGVGAYKIHKRRITWNEARKVCLAEGGHLAVIDSERKEKLFNKWRVEKDLTGFWLGFHDLFEEGAWVTVTGESVDTMSYHPWARDEPNNDGERQNCGILWHRGVDDYECDCKEPFLCEINLCEAIRPVIPDTSPTSVE